MCCFRMPKLLQSAACAPSSPGPAGPRICLGIHFAYMEAPLVLATLLRHYRFELVREDEPEPGATLRPRHGVRMRVHRRR